MYKCSYSLIVLGLLSAICVISLIAAVAYIVCTRSKPQGLTHSLVNPFVFLHAINVLAICVNDFFFPNFT